MSTQHGQFDQRRFRLEESTHLNGGARTVFIEHMTPGTQVPPHRHHRFSETFDLISGSMSVYATDEKPDLEALDASVQELKVGVPVVVPKGNHHMYRVGDEDTVLRCIVTPGDADFERLLMIMNGLARDGRMEGPEALGSSLLLMAIAFDLSDAHVIGPVSDMLKGVKAEQGTAIEELKKSLLASYHNEEGLKDLLRGNA
ncbi:uncharacterized protein HMPREF1541_10252 [Cyphellophora europaea CBS 101466]|uniref:Cupin 2 conserved barrel domain-containing protein n=1 Tax=Cyphellophora europaea (strain CBS 101466) TaxID=1220924 RepID=W2S7B9_CYPE1|nr:uncharacterized protein HMPREF1541_10252 [Cyphellophora europaea CBS 101466]ETN44582.1 hypothetical protein HMPREF1541_10252 [Cyphellophora europaea CBS 101466]